MIVGNNSSASAIWQCCSDCNSEGNSVGSVYRSLR